MIPLRAARSPLHGRQRLKFSTRPICVYTSNYTCASVTRYHKGLGDGLKCTWCDEKGLLAASWEFLKPEIRNPILGFGFRDKGLGFKGVGFSSLHQLPGPYTPTECLEFALGYPGFRAFCKCNSPPCQG